MNQRIRELAIEAGLEMCSCGCDMPTRQSAKFAELIIRECAAIADVYSAGQIILDEFGVDQ